MILFGKHHAVAAKDVRILTCDKGESGAPPYRLVVHLRGGSSFDLSYMTKDDREEAMMYFVERVDTELYGADRINEVERLLKAVSDTLRGFRLRDIREVKPWLKAISDTLWGIETRQLRMEGMEKRLLSKVEGC